MAKENKIRKVQNVLAGIAKNVAKKKWKCIVEECTEDAINSHLLMQNGILNMLTGLLLQSETWGLRPSLFEKIPQEHIDHFFRLYEECCNTLDQSPIETFNLFEGLF